LSTAAITAEDLGKRYRIGMREERPETLVSALVGLVRSPWTNLSRLRSLTRIETDEDRPDLIWALRDVSFEVRAGEVLGVVGRNGAGKSTLLKILSRITEPTQGRAAIRGRVASLLEVGTGFHPELTGRENVYLNGTILGMSKREIDGAFDEIVDFSGVERFLDTPIKRYSSGMKVRLAFAVAAHLRAEVLLIDEVLAVGDAAFQRKCLGKMDDVARSGRTVLFVSHNMATVGSLCPRCLYLRDGGIAFDGPSEATITRYLRDFGPASGGDLAQRQDRRGAGRVRLRSIELLDGANAPAAQIVTGRPATLAVAYDCTDTASSRLTRFNLGLAIHTEVGQFLTALNSEMADRAFAALPPSGRVLCRLPRVPFMPGRYRITATLVVEGRLEDQIEHALELEVEGGDFFGSGIPNSYGRQGIYLPQTWISEG
jgi:lipopolysaccharide transport system ATP-binding protein